MVDRPVVLTVEEIKRLPSVSRIIFLECAGNSRLGRAAHGEGRPRHARPDGLQRVDGRAAVAPAARGRRPAGVQLGATWIVVEGADATGNERSLPLAKAMDDVLVAYGQNGEALRPDNGYPLWLVVPGWEGNVNVKWLRRITIVDRPYMTRMESTGHASIMPDGKARQFNLVMEQKSVITFPSGGQQLGGPGFYEIRGLAWSGRGLVRRVEVSTDGGTTWQDATLQEPVLPLAHTRFRLDWRWDGLKAVLQVAVHRRDRLSAADAD